MRLKSILKPLLMSLLFLGILVVAEARQNSDLRLFVSQAEKCFINEAEGNEQFALAATELTSAYSLEDIYMAEAISAVPSFGSDMQSNVKQSNQNTKKVSGTSSSKSKSKRPSTSKSSTSKSTTSRPSTSRSSTSRPSTSRSSASRSSASRSSASRPSTSRTSASRPSTSRSSTSRTSAPRPMSSKTTTTTTRINSTPAATTAVTPTTKKPKSKIGLPVFAFKTDFLTWGGLLSNMYSAQAIIPNIGLEFYFGRKFSLSLDGSYALPIKEKNEVHFEYQHVSIEPRFWIPMKKNDPFMTPYIGMYGIFGAYNNYNTRDPESPYGRYGTFMGGGLSFGFGLPITKSLVMEVGVRGGYQISTYKEYEYDFETGGVPRGKQDTDSGITLQGVSMSMVYRIIPKRAKVSPTVVVTPRASTATRTTTSTKTNVTTSARPRPSPRPSPRPRPSTSTSPRPRPSTR